MIFNEFDISFKSLVNTILNIYYFIYLDNEKKNNHNKKNSRRTKNTLQEEINQHRYRRSSYDQTCTRIRYRQPSNDMH